MNNYEDIEKVDFDEFLKDCELERLGQIGLEFQSGETYKKLSEQSEEVYDKLEAALPEEMHAVLCRYADMMIDEIGEVEQVFYRQGLMDAAKLIYGLLQGKP